MVHNNFSKSTMIALGFSVSLLTIMGIGCAEDYLVTNCNGVALEMAPGVVCPSKKMPSPGPKASITPPVPTNPGNYGLHTSLAATEDSATSALKNIQPAKTLASDKGQKKGQTGGVSTAFSAGATAGGADSALPQSLAKRPDDTGGAAADKSPELSLGNNLISGGSSQSKGAAGGSGLGAGGLESSGSQKAVGNSVAMNTQTSDGNGTDGKSGYASGGGGGAKPPGGSGDSGSGGSGWGSSGASAEAVADLNFDPDKSQKPVDPVGSADPEDYFVRLGLEVDIFKTVSKRIFKKSAQWITERPAAPTKK
ncbi:hypothetical protein WDW86_07165 [Bdellovibrionota bacterium FG-2]